MRPDCTPLKTCTKCGVEKPATTEFFFAHSTQPLRSHCKACTIAQTTAYRKAHPERARAHAATYRKGHREERLDYNRKYDADRPGERSIYDATYRSEHRDERAAHEANHRAKQIGLEEAITPCDIKAVFSAQNGLCRWCGVEVGPDCHLDHAVPFARGGHNVRGNLAITCPECNRRKGTKLPEEFAPGH